MHGALRHDHAVARRTRHEVELRSPVDRERGQVARVDADHRSVEPDRALELLRVVRLDERVELELPGVAHQRLGALVVEVAQEQQRRVRARRLRLEQV